MHLNFLALSSCTCSTVSLELNGTVVVSYTALYSKKPISSNTRCSTSLFCFLDHNMTLNIFPLPPSQATLQTHKGFACYCVRKEASGCCCLTSFTCTALLNTPSHLTWCSSAISLSFKIFNNSELIDAPCVPWWSITINHTSPTLQPQWLITFPSQEYASLYILLKILTLRARNWILLCRTEKPCTKTPFAAVSTNTHSPRCIFNLLFSKVH